MKKTKCYKFKEVDLVSLRELALKVKSQTGFRLRYGGLLTLLRTDVEEKLVHTLVQFYDPSFRCFTFPDFQLVPTLEAYSNLVGLPIAEKTPFTGPGTSLTPLVIAKDLYLKTSDVSNHLITKSHIRGFTSKYLLEQANLSSTCQDTLEAILALLIYGLILFSNLDNFVDMNAIEVFHSKNPVPTLLADTYHAIHDRTLKGRGYILCCISLLYRWFISHLPSSFHDNSENWSYSQRIMALTPNEVVWLTPAAQVKEIIMGCGDFLNVPLLGTRGGINYNPQLSYRGIPLMRSTFLVKAFDGSRKNVLGEIDLPITIGPENFLITFQVMDINASYSCLLGRPWIHDAGAVTSTLHQKLKFIRNGKLVTIHGKEAYLVSQLSSFSCIEAGSAEGTAFQGLTVEGTEPKRDGTAMASLKDAQRAVQEGQAAGWGKLIQLRENKHKEGLGFSPTSGVSTGAFCSAGFVNAITEEATGFGPRPVFVTPGGFARDWDAIDIPSIMHVSE
ncbi:hypothetical protein MTR_5g041255 [Medicago truncatula]|uniref:DUF7745 domain-containing protein n=1 Tax=Medicago truncatula TaxID=3880 RepID=A0A072UDZ1_MEDTR|nr:hypothetical protein MTR_5g041255 [Medicago truncatula]